MRWEWARAWPRGHYRSVISCLIRILGHSSEEVHRRTFAAPELTAVGYRKCHTISNL
jgi:hypothetical protein